MRNSYESDIEHPMETVFHTPVRANHLGMADGMGRQTTDVEPDIRRGFVPELAGTAHHDDRR
jgi:hypothetical protein